MRTLCWTALFVLGLASTSFGVPTYHLTDIGSQIGETHSSRTWFVADSGLAFGHWAISAERGYFLYDPTTRAVDTFTLAGAPYFGTTSVAAWGINSAGDVVFAGYGCGGNEPSYIRHRNGTWTHVNAGNSCFRALDINDAGVVAGMYQDDTNRSRAAVWEAATGLRPIPVVDSEREYVAQIEGDTVLGWYETGFGREEVFTYDVMTGDIATHGNFNAGITRTIRPRALNALGQMVGETFPMNGWPPRPVFEDENGQRTVFGETGTTHVRGLNDASYAVGTTNVFNGSDTAYVWHRTEGLTNLMTVTDLPDTWSHLNWASGINNRGQIGGSGFSDGYENAMVLTPIVTGDVNHDGLVNRYDLARFTTHYGLSTEALWEDGDFDGNGRVDLSDLGLLQQNWSHASVATAAAIPEPSTEALMGIFLAIVGFMGIRVIWWKRQ
jgi:hypothetical protein